MGLRSSLEANLQIQALHSLLWALESTAGIQCLGSLSVTPRSPGQQEAGKKVGAAEATES